MLKLTKLSPCSRLLLKKLTVPQLVKKFSTFYGTRRFTSARHPFLYWARSIQPMLPHPTSWRSILILSSPSTPRSSKWSLSLSFPHQNPVCTSPVPHTCHLPLPYILLGWITRIWWGVQTPCYFVPLGLGIFFSALFSNTLSLCSFLNARDEFSHPYKTTGKIIFLYILIFIFLDRHKILHRMIDIFL